MAENFKYGTIKEKIDLYVEGKLSSEAIDELWAELLADEQSYDYLKTAASLKGLSRSGQPAEAIPADTGLSGLPGRQKWYAAAAAFLVAGVLTVFSLSDDTVQPVGSEPVASIELDYYRSSNGQAAEEEGDGASTLLLAVREANSGNTPEAVKLIHQRLQQTENPEERQELHLAAGSFFYNAGSYKEAAGEFEEGVKIEDGSRLSLERTYWYLGNAYLQMNRTEDAMHVFGEVESMNGAYNRVARSYLENLR